MGGQSRRFGENKALFQWQGASFLERICQALEEVKLSIYIISKKNQAHYYSDSGRKIITDLYPEQTPLVGLLSALEALPSRWVLLVACDMPAIQPPLLNYLITLAKNTSQGAIVPIYDGRPQPLLALYSKGIYPQAREYFLKGGRSLKGLVEQISVQFVPQKDWQRYDSQGLSFLNINRQEDLARLTKALGSL
ncbi:molybdenum cofactor guanylyltransferase [Thermosulfuriphilus sp.]